MLNPEEGHEFMPYIVLVIDEFADLIMTAGKEIGITSRTCLNQQGL